MNKISGTRIEEICSLCVDQRTMTDGALDSLLRRDNCDPVSLSQYRIAHFHKGGLVSSRKQAALCVMEKELYVKGSTDRSFSVTDLKTTKAKLILSDEAFRSLLRGGGSDITGKIVAVLDPVCSTDSKSGELVLAATRQQEVVVLGRLQHMTVCSGLKKDGTPCSMITDMCISDRCMYHRHIPTTSRSHAVGSSHSAVARDATHETAPSKPRVVKENPPTDTQTVSAEPVDLFDAVLHAKQKPKEDIRTVGKSADILATGLDDEEGGGPLVTLDSSSDDDSMAMSCEKETIGKGLLKKASTTSVDPPWVGGTTARRDGVVQVPQQSSVFGSVPVSFAKQQNKPQTTASMGSTDGIHRPGTMPIKSANSLLSGSGLGGLYSNRPAKPTNSLYSRPKSDIIAGGETLLIDKTKLLSNAQSIAKMAQNNCPEHKRKAETAAQVAAKKRKQAIDDLLSRKSSHADEEKDEWFDQYNKKLEKIQWREAKTEKENEKKMITVKAYHCKECQTTLEAPNALCRQRQHHVTTVSAQKRYFECQKCRRRTFTLGSMRLPDRACGFCGSFDFISTGKAGSGLSSSSGSRNVGLMGERLVTGKTEWTSRGDIDQLASSTSSLK